MRSTPFTSITLLAVLASLVPGEVHATPRGEVPPPEPETAQSREARRLQTAHDLAAWLPQLVGRFSYEGVVEFLTVPGVGGAPNQRRARGLGDCINVGTGPGVQCVLNVTWDEEWTSDGRAVAGGVPFLGPAVILYGFEPRAGVIRYMQLDTDGLVNDGQAVLKGTTLRWVFDGHCSSMAQSNGCRQTTRIYTPPGGRYMQMTLEIEDQQSGNAYFRLNLDMRRVPQLPAGEAARAPPVPRKH